jgi:arginine utilization protein RocB
LVEQEYAGTAGMIMAFFLVLGIGTGVNFSLILGIIFTDPKV